MAKQSWKPGNMLYPVPAVLVSVADKEGKSNLFTVAWTGTVCSDPPMLSISVRKNRFSHKMLMNEKNELFFEHKLNDIFVRLSMINKLKETICK